MAITLPLGARLAAEHAYENLTPASRRDPAHVAKALLTAAAPFMAPVVAQLGRCRINPDGAADILQRFLAGESTATIADRYAVTPATVNKYIQRGMTRTRIRVAAGVPVGTIAAENRVTSAVVVAALDLGVTSRAS